jgi:hypothetical protein
VAHPVVTELPALHYLGRGPASEVANLSSPISWSSTNSKEEEGEDRRELSPVSRWCRSSRRPGVPEVGTRDEVGYNRLVGVTDDAVALSPGDLGEPTT